MSVRSRKLDRTPASLPVASPDEFFPAVSRWSLIGGGVLFVAFAAPVPLAGVLRFNVTVRAEAAIRPAGELRVVQAKIEGTVAKILVTEDQVVEEGGVLAYVDDTRLRRERSRLQIVRENADLQTGQIQAQLTALDRQIEAQNNLLARRQSGAEAQLQWREREHAQLLATTTADAEEARAEVEFARDELARYRTLAEQGVVSQIDIRARETKLSSLEAKLKRIEAALDPSAAAIRIATENIDEERARGDAALATLHRERE